MEPLYARRHWVSKSQFHDLSPAEVLREVSRRVTQSRSRPGAPAPLVLLDLDSTLYEVGPRTHAIFTEWSRTPEAAEFKRLRDALGDLHPTQVGYSVRDTLEALGFEVGKTATAASELDAGLESVKAFWQQRFFKSAYLPHDRAYPGAAEFTREVHRLGADIVYLTGRDEPNMGEGTRSNLVRDGFPWGTKGTHLLLKVAPEVPDLDHKKEAAHYLRRHGELIASFENEPLNLVALYDLFPEAMHVFVETVCSDHEAPVRGGLYRLPTFTS